MRAAVVCPLCRSDDSVETVSDVPPLLLCRCGKCGSALRLRHGRPSRRIGASMSSGNENPVHVEASHRMLTGVMTAPYRMTGEHWTADQAFAEMRTYKYGADFLDPEFKQFVYAYQRAAPAHAIVAL